MKIRIPPTNRRRMAGREPHVVTALRRKYAELKGWSDTEAMTYVGQTLLLFNPGEDFAAIPGLKARTQDREASLRDALDILRQSPVAMSARPLAKRILRARAGKVAREPKAMGRIS